MFALTPQLSLEVTGQNLFEPSHYEMSESVSIIQATRIPRSTSARLSWRF